MKAKFEIYEDKAHRWRWRLKVGRNIIADSGQGYASKSGCRQAVAGVTGWVQWPGRYEVVEK